MLRELKWAELIAMQQEQISVVDQLLNERKSPELDRDYLFFRCVLLVLSVSLVAIPAISHEKRHRRLIV